jgi:hypothetical protein
MLSVTPLEMNAQALTTAPCSASSSLAALTVRHCCWPRYDMQTSHVALAIPSV